MSGLLVDRLPILAADCVPPTVLGTAALSAMAFRGAGFAEMIRRIAESAAAPVARDYDHAIACQLMFQRDEGLALQAGALDRCTLYRVARGGPHGLRMLALLAPGDLMTNTPLDFITAHTDIRLDLLYLLPGRALPQVVPDHDLMFFAASEGDAEAQARWLRLFRGWPRPALNAPSHLPGMARDVLPRRLAGIASVRSPPAVMVSRERLAGFPDGGHGIGGQGIGELLPGCGYPVLIRPLHSHAGAGLARLDGPGALADYLLFSGGPGFMVTAFVDYRSPDGMFRKYRIAFIERRAFLCHMAVSSHWMVHYLNAGMAESAEKRAQEASAMARFDRGFALRHADALAQVAEALGFDYCSIDCAETPDGRLLVFEADSAAIVHMLDPPELYPYKPAQMRRVFAAFAAMARSRAAPDLQQRALLQQRA